MTFYKQLNEAKKTVESVSTCIVESELIIEQLENQLSGTPYDPKTNQSIGKKIEDLKKTLTKAIEFIGNQ